MSLSTKFYYPIAWRACVQEISSHISTSVHICLNSLSSLWNVSLCIYFFFFQHVAQSHTWNSEALKLSWISLILGSDQPKLPFLISSFSQSISSPLYLLTLLQLFSILPWTIVIEFVTLSPLSASEPYFTELPDWAKRNEKCEQQMVPRVKPSNQQDQN